MTLTLSDGTVFHNSHAIENGTNLHIYVQDGKSDIRDVFEAFIDPEKTSEITFQDLGDQTAVFRGYNKLIAVRDEGRGLFTAILTVRPA